MRSETSGLENAGPDMMSDVENKKIIFLLCILGCTVPIATGPVEWCQ